MHPSHFLLIAALMVGGFLRLFNLDGKPLWMDEVITSIFSLGLTYDAVPVGKLLSVEQLTQFLRLQPHTTCADITQHVVMQSAHPPLFFCGMQHWLQLFKHTGISLGWQVRGLAALIGTATIGLAYGISRIGLRSPWMAVVSAGIMAVSPFGIYLAQEGRHYTLALAMVMLGLLCLMQIQQDWRQGKLNPLLWVSWAASQTIGFYTHYFCLIASVGQIGALMLWHWWRHPAKCRPIIPFWLPIGFTVSAIGFTLVPWIGIFSGHITQPETRWMQAFEPNLLTFLSPLWQLPIGWISMIIVLPVETQPLWIAIPSVVAAIGFTAWLIPPTYRGWLRLWQNQQTRDSTMLLTSFVMIVLLAFLTIIFGLQKDISQVPRYNFVYYPAVCILLAASLLSHNEEKLVGLMAQRLFLLMLIGILSSVLINHNLAFQKPFRPEQVATQISTTTSSAPLIIMAYENHQEIALGLSFALALRDINPQTMFIFLSRINGYQSILQKLPFLPDFNDFWLIAPGLRQAEFPDRTQVGKQHCQRLADRYYRIGIPYQGYKCE